MQFLVLALMSAALTAAGWACHRKYEGEPPLLLALALYLGGALLLGAIGIGSVIAQGGGFGAIFFVQLMACISLPAMIVLGINSAGSFASNFSTILFDPREADPEGFQFARAKAKAVQGDTDGAIREYRRYHELNPDRPGPLFAAASFAERKGQYAVAATLYREIMHHFGKSRPVWAESALRLARLLDQQFQDAPGATRLLTEIAARAPRLPQGKQAAEMLRRRQHRTS